MTKEEIMEIKSEMEKNLQRTEFLAAELKKAGFNVAMGKNNTVYIYKTHVEEYGERPHQPNG